VVFPVLHGTFGEDGTVQGLLELAALPYVGAGVLASAVSMDKVVTKRLCQQAGLPIADYVVTRAGACSRELELPFAYPVFVKPANLGSSVGISKVKEPADLCEAVNQAGAFDQKVIIERGIEGREFECAVLGGEVSRAAMPCEIIPSQEFYTYEDKYVLDEARIELPANLPGPKILEMQELAVRAFEAVNCEGMARVDFLMESSSGQLFVNEVNTIPGFTSISMFPKMWEYSGLPYPKLLDRLIELALKRAEVRSQTRFSL
jgi:D-alanine-D-alanine ligase